MKILVLTNIDIGLYKFRKELLEKLLLNHKVYIALPDGEYIGKLQEMGAIFCPIDIERRGKNIFQEFRLICDFFKIIKTVKPDVILTYTIKPNIYGGTLCQILHKPYIVNITGLGTEVEKNNIFSRALVICYRKALKKAACIFFQNQSNRKFFLKSGLRHQNVKCLPGSGVNLLEHCYEEYPDTKNGIVFLFIGRIMKDKGVGELVIASKRLQKKFKNIKVQLVGFCEDDYKNELERLNARKYVEFCGQQEDVHSFIKNCHAVVLPSYHEGMANVLLEAAASGRPVLASNVPGCRETFREGISGFGFAARSAKELEKAMEKFISLDYDKKVQMGKAGRKKMENQFSRDIVIDMYEEEINKLAHSGRKD